MGVAGEGPDLSLIAAAFRASCDVSSLMYYHPDAKKAEKFAKEIGALPASNAQEFVSGVGAAELLTIPGGRAELAESLLRAGVHVSLRKPIADNLEEVESLAAAARESKSFLSVDDEAFFFEPYNKLKELVGKMEVGEICAARFRVNLAGEGGWGPQADLLKTNYGLFHPCFDIIAYAIELLGDVESVMAYLNPMKTGARGKGGGQSMIALKFKSAGCYGVVELTYAPGTAIRTEGYPCDASIELAGTDGIIWANHFYGKMTETPWLEVRRGKKYFSLGIASGMAVEWPDAVRASAAHFATNAAYGTAPKPGIERSRSALKVILAAIEASESGSEIHLI